MSIATRVAVAVSAAALLLTGACSTTSLSNVYRAPGAEPTVLKKVMVFGLSKDEGVRRTLEDAFVSKLGEKGVQATASLSSSMGGLGEKSREELKEMIAREGYDGVITVRVLDVQERQTYEPDPWYGDFYGYYATVVPTVMAPGYIETSTDVRSEANVYRIAGEGQSSLIWSTLGDTFDPKDVSSGASSFAGKVVGQLEKDGLLPSGAKK